MVGRRPHEVHRRDEAGAELTLDAAAELPHHGARVVAIRRPHHDARQVDVRRVEEVGREAVLQTQDGHGAGAPGLHVDVRQSGRIERELVLRSDPVELVVEDPEAGAEDRAAVQRVDRADAGREVVPVGLDQRPILQRPRCGEDQRAGGRIEVRHAVVLFGGRRHVVVAHAQVHGERVADLPIVLHVGPVRLELLFDHEHVGQLRPLRVAEHEIGQPVAGELAVEREVAARRRHVEVLVVHGRHHVEAELHLMRAAQPGQRVQELHLVGVLGLRHEVGRPEPQMSRHVHADDAARHRRIGGAAAKPNLRVAVLAEGVLRAVVGAARVREARLVDERPAEHLGPARHQRVRVEVVAAPRRRGGAVEDAAEEPRNVAEAVTVDVAREEVVVVGERKVEAEQVAFRFVLDVRLPQQVVATGGVRRRQQRRDRHRHGIEPSRGDGVVRERLSGQRIANGAREHPSAFIGGEDPSRAQHALLDAGGFDIGEEERAVAHDRATEVAAELILIVRRLLRTRALGEEVVRIERLVAEEVIARAVERVRAGFRAHDDRRTGRPAVFSGIRAGHHLELVDRVHRGARELGGQLLHVGREAVVGDAVEQEVVLQAPVAVHADAASTACRGAPGLFGVAVTLDAGHERQQVVPIANRQREPRHLVAIDDRAEYGALGAQQWRDPRHRHRFADRAHRQRHVEARPRAQFELHRLFMPLEARRFDLHQILARRQVHDEIAAGAARDGGGHGVGGQAGDLHLSLRNHGIRRILDDARHGRAVHLRRGGCRHTEHHYQQHSRARHSP